MTPSPGFSTRRAATLDAAELLACLPESMRQPATEVTRIAAGMSGAGVYRVRTATGEFALKITAADEPLDAWRAKVDIQRAAGNVGIAPMVVHADADRRAVLSAFVADRGFYAFYYNPATHGAAIDSLGSMLRLMHALPVDASMAVADPMAFLERLERATPGDAKLPPFVQQARDQLRRDTGMHAAQASDAEQPVTVLSHNDVNPSNLVFDGERVVLLDWQTPAPNDRYYDLATIALFLRMDAPRCLRLLSSYAQRDVLEVPARFTLLRRTAAALSGTASMHVALSGGHPGSNEPALPSDTRSLGEVYAAMQAGQLQLGTPDGQWAFGLALIRESLPG